MSNVRIADPGIEPVSLTDLKQFGKLIDTTAEDTTLTLCIKAARELFELTTGLALVTQTWRLFLDTLPGAEGAEPWWDGVREGAITELTPVRNWFVLPTTPLLTVSSFKAYQGDNSSTTFLDYFLDIDSKPGRVILNFGAVWPIATRPQQRYEVVYTAGFGPAAENVPSDIRLCIMQLALHFKENPEAMTYDVAAVKVPIHCERIMTRRKIKRLT